MTKKQTENMFRFAAKFGVHDIDILWKFRRIEIELNRINCADCNGELTDKQGRRREKFEGSICIWAKSLSAGIKFNRDPRGYAFRFILSDKTGNSLAGGWGIDF
jgi:hypothetical protein